LGGAIAGVLTTGEGAVGAVCVGVVLARLWRCGFLGEGARDGALLWCALSSKAWMKRAR
jgi:hypothetical protein